MLKTVLSFSVRKIVVSRVAAKGQWVGFWAGDLSVWGWHVFLMLTFSLDPSSSSLSNTKKHVFVALNTATQQNPLDLYANQNNSSPLFICR